MVQDLKKKNLGGGWMTIIRCKKSYSVNPYVVSATNMVKECPTVKTIELENCRNCDSYVKEQN
jgi:hypothetical protein